MTRAALPRRPSPHQTRLRGELAVRNRIAGACPVLPLLREPAKGETPLSPAEISFAVSAGLLSPVVR